MASVAVPRWRDSAAPRDGNARPLDDFAQHCIFVEYLDLPVLHQKLSVCNDSSDGLGCYGVCDLADWIIEWNEAVIPSVEQYEICLFAHLDAADLFVPLAASRAIDRGHA